MRGYIRPLAPGARLPEVPAPLHGRFKKSDAGAGNLVSLYDGVSDKETFQDAPVTFTDLSLPTAKNAVSAQTEAMPLLKSDLEAMASEFVPLLSPPLCGASPLEYGHFDSTAPLLDSLGSASANEALDLEQQLEPFLAPIRLSLDVLNCDIKEAFAAIDSLHYMFGASVSAAIERPGLDLDNPTCELERKAPYKDFEEPAKLMDFCLEPKPEAEAEKEAGEEGSIEDVEAPDEDFEGFEGREEAEAEEEAGEESSGGHPRCASREDCIGDLTCSLVQHVLNGESGDIYCEPCWNFFCKRLPTLKGNLLLDEVLQKEEEDDDEELEDLPDAVKKLDPFYKVVTGRKVDGKVFIGVVEDIDCGKITKERFYRVKYTDGDLEHMTKDQVKSMQIRDEGGEDSWT